MESEVNKEAENKPAENVDEPVESAVVEEAAKDSDVSEIADNAPTETEKLQGRLEAAYGKQAELQNNYLRKAADLDNMRKRLARDREEITAAAITGLLEDLLPSIDAFRLGLDAAHGKEGTDEIVKGFAMALDQMNEILLRRGLETVDPVGEVFDPALHEALSQEHSEEVDEGKILRVMRVGYRLNERLLRPAAVIVSTGSVGTTSVDEKQAANE